MIVSTNRPVSLIPLWVLIVMLGQVSHTYISRIFQDGLKRRSGSLVMLFVGSSYRPGK